MKSKINGAKIKEVKERITEIKEDLGREGTYEDMYHVLRRDLVNITEDAESMIGVIESIRENVHTTEEAEGSVLWIAELLGTNCEPGRGIDDE